MAYPDNCIRGIPNDNFITPEGHVISGLFSFQENPERSDGWKELSINWEEDDNALRILFEQRKGTGEIQFKVGGARIPRDEIDRLNKRPMISGFLSYEKQSLEDNPYHGNILIRLGLSKPIESSIKGALAVIVSHILQNEIQD